MKAKKPYRPRCMTLDEFRDWFLTQVVKVDDHWIWQGSLNVYGYGMVWDKSQNIFAHRMSYELFKGPIPEGLFILHIQTCSYKSCTNPDHLYAGTSTDNQNDKEILGTGNHPYGSRNGSAKLTEAQVREIRKLRKEGVSCPEIAKMYYVGNATIWYVIARKSWIHVK